VDIKVFTHKKDLQNARKNIREEKKIGFIPTMGNLHEGHISLIRESFNQNDITFISIFVNPLQFDQDSDLKRYPKTLQEDIKLIEQMKGNHEVIIFAPESAHEILPQNLQTQICVSPLNNMIEGLSRPGHFNGVTTVVYFLLQLVKPRNAYFGKKDFQQFVIIKKMVSDLDIDVTIQGLETQREKSGLALSSRNQFLTSQDHIIALNLRNTLLQLKREFTQFHDLQKKIKDIKKNDSSWDYLELRRASDLATPSHSDNQLVILAVYKVGSVRLLDNIEITVSQ